ncbi:MAG TPA: DUF5666 domain-containing protein [Thermoanaerobaculia bacterium]|nr:DUF5666 domain-containing protein [Thermoanaerobaculia bacterium]
MRTNRFILTILVAIALSSCNRHESVTGSYGQSVISGQVVMSSEVANGNPAGVAVSVVGTGMTATVGADGRFTFIGVPDHAELTFRRGDGIDSRVRLSNASSSLVVEVSSTGAKVTNSSGGRRRSSSKKDPGPSQEFEATLVNDATADSLTIHDSHGNDVVIALTPTTLIRKGNLTVLATDLKAGDRVHVKATKVNDVLTASQVIVQEPDDDAGQNNQQTQEIEGLVVTAAADSLTVHDSQGHDVTVVITSTTIVRKGNQTVDPATLKKDDRVHVKAEMVNGVLTATEVIVQNTNGNGDDDENQGTTMTANGPVRSVSGTSLVVFSQPKGEVTVNTDGSTIIKKQGQRISVTDIKPGDEVNCLGARVDDHTMNAKQIEVRGNSKH